MRKQLDELESDKRRLVLAKEIALSPAEIKRVARKIGFTETVSKIAAVPGNISAAIKPGTEKLAQKVKQSVVGKIETIKKAIEAPAKETVKTPAAKEKTDKSQAQVAAR